MNDDEFEKALLDIFSNPKRDPKYKLWAHTNRGLIVGFRYQSVGYSFNCHEHRGFPGWHYSCLSVDAEGVLPSELEEFLESEIELID